MYNINICIYIYIHEAETMCDYTNKSTPKRRGTCGRRMGSDLLKVEREVVVEDAMDLGEYVQAEVAQVGLANWAGFCFQSKSIRARCCLCLCICLLYSIVLNCLCVSNCCYQFLRL